MVLSAIVYRRR